MLEEGRISSKQLQWLIIISMLPTVLLILPSGVITVAKQDSWLSIILTGIIGLITGYIVTKLGKRFPNKTIIGYSPLIVGKFLGKIISFIYILFFIHITAVIIREFGEVLSTFLLIKTPLMLIILSIVVIAASAVRNGIEVIARVNELILPSFIAILIIIFSLIFPDLELSNLNPVLENGLSPVLKAAYPTSLFLTEAFILIIILPTINHSEKTLNSVFKATAITTFLGVVMILEIITLFGGVEGSRFELPMLSLVRYISLFDFIDRIDALVVVMWIGGGFVKITIFYYCLVISTAEFFNLRSYKPVVLPLGIILVAFAIILFGNSTEVSEVVSKILPPYYLFLKIGIPLILLIIASIRGISDS